jgi:endonuclease III
MAGDVKAALGTFAKAFAYVEAAGFLAEVEWQNSRHFSEFTESDLLREAAWVILCGGFREAVVRRVFDHISLSFFDWESSAAIVGSASVCHSVAMGSFRNRRKLDAIVMVADRIDKMGFETLKSRILDDPIQELRMLPHIGPITSWHLAKNLGFDAAKPDRHLVRLCDRLGFSDVQELCGSVAAATGNAICVVDIILWRYLAKVEDLKE